MTMTVEILAPDDPKSTQVEINLNQEELVMLIYQLESIRIGKTDHIHFMSPDWGGDYLGTKALNPSSQVAHHLRITLINDV